MSSICDQPRRIYVVPSEEKYIQCVKYLLINLKEEYTSSHPKSKLISERNIYQSTKEEKEGSVMDSKYHSSLLSSAPGSLLLTAVAHQQSWGTQHYPATPASDLQSWWLQLPVTAPPASAALTITASGRSIYGRHLDTPVLTTTAESASEVTVLTTTAKNIR